MILYIDISEFLKTRFSTGIQRVIKEFLKRVISEDFSVYILSFDTAEQKYKTIDILEMDDFLKNTQYYEFKKLKDIDLFKNSLETKIFFEIDAVWNADNKREKLYKKLKSHNFKIYNFIYDLIPINLPALLRENTKQNFPSFIQSVHNYSDFIFFDSFSAQQDYKTLKNKKHITRNISTQVVNLGSDFINTTFKSDKNYSKLLSEKYILFVGTIEPRKQQAQLLKAFEVLHKEHQDLNLIFIGKIGWKVDSFISDLNSHPLKDKNIYHLSDVDDYELNQFYTNAYIVTYLSMYEGYGLPIAESLCHGNITIASKNSSMVEVGENFADYIQHNTQKEIIDIITMYLKDKDLYKQKKSYIKNHYKANTWSEFYNSIITAIKLRK